MRFRVLGPLQIEREGTAITLASESQRLLLLVLLASANRVVATDSLGEALWGDEQPRHPTAAVQSSVYRLRQQIGSGEGAELVTQPPGYMLRVQTSELDALRFDVLITEVAAKHDPGAEIQLLDEALKLWRGAAYAEFADHELVSLEAIRLQEEYRNAIEARFQCLLDLDRFTDAIPALEAFVSTEPLRERALAS